MPLATVPTSSRQTAWRRTPASPTPVPMSGWEAYAAEHGFILRWPQERQAATGMVFEPWHWRYVGRDNALAIRASGLSLEEYLALEQTK